jgi:signal transduction histidine kinase
VTISVAVIDSDREAPAEVRDAFSSAIGEAVANALEHAHPSNIIVFVEVDDDSEIFASVRDDGAGFDVDHTRLGHGVTESIVARVRDVGGRSEIVSSPGDGTEVRLWST